MKKMTSIINSIIRTVAFFITCLSMTASTVLAGGIDVEEPEKLTFHKFSGIMYKVGYFSIVVTTVIAVGAIVIKMQKNAPLSKKLTTIGIGLAFIALITVLAKTAGGI